MARKKTKGPLGPLVDFLGSYGLAVVLLMFLFVLVWRATLTYGALGEPGVKQTYFIPWVAHLGSMPFPGGRTVFSLLALNLGIGGLVRLRWSRRTAGVIITHLGIVGLVLAGVVNFTLSDYGMLRLDEGQTGNSYQDATHYELSVWEASQQSDVREFLVGDADLRSVAETGRTFSSDQIPFDLELSGFLLNSRPLPKGPMWEAASPVVEGWALRRLPRAEDPRNNQPGVVVRVTTPTGVQTGLLHVYDPVAWTIEVEGKLWAVHLHHVRHPLPFKVEVVDTVREDHPGSTMPRTYHSDVIYQGQRKARISMNQPLREEGHVLYQSGWGRYPDGREWTAFSIARNPSDQWPKWMCWVIAVGLLFTFGNKIAKYTTAQLRQRAKKEAV
jgi:ResB-like family